MKKPSPFLTARWLNLLMISYRLDPSMLEPFLPPDCVLDLIDGSAFASLVGFQFADTRVMGIRWPGFVNFSEINLRFHVRHGNQGGICFLREYVQLRTVARIAHWVYNEPFAIAPVNSRVKSDSHNRSVQYTLQLKGKTHSAKAITAAEPVLPASDSLEFFFKEQQWGFGTSRRGRLIRYQVLHPAWQIHPVQSFELDWDWQAVYGPHWAPLQHMRPVSVMLVAGSAVELFPHGKVGPFLAAAGLQPADCRAHGQFSNAPRSAG